MAEHKRTKKMPTRRGTPGRSREKRLPLSMKAQRWARGARQSAVRLALVPADAQQRCHYVRVVEPDGTVTYKYVCELVHSE